MLRFFNGWVVFTLLLYYLGPVPWENRDSPAVALYVSLCLVFFNIGVLLPVRRDIVLIKSVAIYDNRVQYCLILAYILLTAIQTQIIVGRSIFNPADYSFEFGNIYENFVTRASEFDGGTVALVIVVLKMFVFPLVLFIYCDALGKNIVKVLLIAFPLVSSSMMRGTDKELMDLAVITVVPMFFKGLINRKTMGIFLLVPIFLLAFLARRIDRFGGTLPPCLSDGITCFDASSFAASISPSLEVLYVFITSYLAQGYFALGLALGLEAEWGYGIGHLPPVKSIICSVFGIGCDIKDYQAALNAVGWDPLAQWTSVYPILANDLTYFGVPLYFLLLGFVFRAAQVSWNGQRSTSALCTLLIVAQFFIFSSANMQIAISVDWVVATILFLYLPTLRLIGLVGHRK